MNIIALAQMATIIAAYDLHCEPRFATLCARREFTGYHAIDCLVAELQRMYEMCEISESLDATSIKPTPIVQTLPAQTRSLTSYIGQCIQYIMTDPSDVEIMSNDALIDTILAIAHGRHKFSQRFITAAWAEMQRRLGDAPDSVYELLQNLPF